MRSLIILLVFFIASVETGRAQENVRGWGEAKYFGIGDIEGRKTFVDPYGASFHAVSIVYSFGPEGIVGIQKSLSLENVLEEFSAMKEHGFNTVDLYGDMYFDEILQWCEKNEMAVYPRTNFGSLKGLSPERRDFPDFMDPDLRARVKEFYRSYLLRIKDYRCVLAVNMDAEMAFYD